MTHCPHNNIDCPCTKEACPRHGKCCECVAHHKEHGKKLPACLRKKVERSTQPTSNELANRARFTAVSAAIKARKADLLKVTEDEAAFIAQKNLPGGKQSLKAWYWMICGAAYDQEHGN